MKTIKCKIKNNPDIREYLLKYNDVLRISYNRFIDKMSQPDIKKFINPKFNGLNSFIIQNAIVQAQGIIKRNKDSENKNKLIFGGKSNLRRYLRKLISKDEYKQNKLSPMIISGENRHYGNRLFNFDFGKSQVIFKPNKGIKIEIEFICGKKQLEELKLIQSLCDNKEASIVVKLTNNEISFIFNETLIKDKILKDLKQNRILGIDLNPNYIGVSILEFGKNDEFKILHKQVFDLSKLIKKNKKKFELYQINHKIIELCNYWKVSSISIEELKIEHKSLEKGKRLNRLCLNDWCRNLTINNLKLLASVYGIKFIDVNPCYSSQIGNILYGNNSTPDMIASSIEIGRRGYKKFSKGWFYPRFTKSLNLLNEQWKQTLRDNFIKDWKELFSLIKNSKLKYRILLDNCKNNGVFSLNNKKSLVSYMIFNEY